LSFEREGRGDIAGSHGASFRGANSCWLLR
jgi:hypothetical protein